MEVGIVDKGEGSKDINFLVGKLSEYSQAFPSLYLDQRLGDQCLLSWSCEFYFRQKKI